MKANKKYIAPDGHEYFMCPMTEFKITQVENVGTHLGTKAIDVASAKAGYKAPYYAPATVKCVEAIPSHGEATWITTNKVHCPNGYFGYVAFVTVHDNSFNSYVGQVVPQGVQLGNMGDKGNASGVHLHIECTQSNNATMTYNKHGVYTFVATESYVDDTWYMDDTNILTPMKGNWRKVPKNEFNTKELIQEDGVAKLTVDNVAIRKGNPINGTVVKRVSTGYKQTYTHKWVGNRHRYVAWKEGSVWHFMAVSGSEKQGVDTWATFSEVPKPTTPQKPTEKPTEPQQPSQPEFSDNPSDVNFLEEPNLENELLYSQHGLSIVQELEVKKDFPIKCPFTMKAPKGVVVHNAGTNGNPSAKELNNSMLNSTIEKSWHFSVDESGAIQGLPINRNSWSVGDGLNGDGNRNYISIEICRDMYVNNATKQSDPNWEKARDNGALLVAILLNKYGWNINHLKKHQDFKMTDGTHKYCPHHILDEGWDKFVSLVQEKLNDIQGIKPQNPMEEENIGLINQFLKIFIALGEFFLKLFGIKK